MDKIVKRRVFKRRGVKMDNNVEKSCKEWGKVEQERALVRYEDDVNSAEGIKDFFFYSVTNMAWAYMP